MFYISKNRAAIKLQDKLVRMQEDSRPKPPKQDPVYRDLQNIVNKMQYR